MEHNNKTMEIRPQIDIKNDANETLACSKIVVPMSMRSHYWKYFGFPSDDFNNILTKKKIICVLCQTAICYNKNTSNLRTHLVAKHADIYIQLNEAKNSESTTKKQKLSGTIINNHSTNHDSDGSNIQNRNDNNEKQESEIVKPSDLNFIEIDNTDEFVAVHNEDYDDFHDSLEIEEIDQGQIEIINDNQQTQIIQPMKSTDLVTLISEMLIKDLLSPKIILGNGFKVLMQQLNSSFNDVSITEVENSIHEAYCDQSKIVAEYIKKNSNEAPYCLGLEILDNFEQKKFLNLYFIHMINDNGYAFKHVFYKSIKLTKQIDCSKLFYDENINLLNCAAFIVNESNDLITSFANEKGIPVMISLDILIANVVKAVFQIETIQILLDKLTDWLVSNEDYRAPDIDDRYSWSKYTYLKYIYEPIFQSKLLIKPYDNLLEQTKEILELLNPLRLILDTIADETPYASLIKPLSEQLLEQNYNLKENDTQLTIEIKNLIKQEITEKILDNKFFIETSFLDPRFQHFLSSNDRNLTKTVIVEKLKSCLPNDEKQTKFKIDKSNSSRKSSLKMFFNQSMDKKNLQMPPSKSVIEIELEKYSNEVSIDLEYCPITWWDSNDYLYKNLKKYSMKCFTVPCNINNLFKLKIDEEIMLLNRRFLLDEKSIKTLWFLHTNCENSL